MNYQFIVDFDGNTNGVRCAPGGACIPFAPDNRDYVQFLEDWKNGAEVLNPDGTPAPYVAPETP